MFPRLGVLLASLSEVHGAGLTKDCVAGDHSQLVQAARGLVRATLLCQKQCLGPAVDLLLGLAPSRGTSSQLKLELLQAKDRQEIQSCATGLGINLEFRSELVVETELLAIGVNWLRELGGKVAKQLLARAKKLVLYVDLGSSSSDLHSAGSWLEKLGGDEWQFRGTTLRRIYSLQGNNPMRLYLPFGTSEALASGNTSVHDRIRSILHSALTRAHSFWMPTPQNEGRVTHVAVTISRFKGCRLLYTKMMTALARLVKIASSLHGAFTMQDLAVHFSSFPVSFTSAKQYLPRGVGQLDHSGYPMCIPEPVPFPCGRPARLYLSPWVPRCCDGGQCEGAKVNSHFEPMLASYDSSTSHLSEIALLVVLDEFYADECPPGPAWMKMERGPAFDCPNALDLDLDEWGFGRRLILSFKGVHLVGPWHIDEVSRLESPVAVTFRDFRGCLSNYFHLMMNAAIPLWHLLFLHSKKVKELYLPNYLITWGQKVLAVFFPAIDLHFVDWIPFCCLPACSPHQQRVPWHLAGLPLVELSSNELDGEQEPGGHYVEKERGLLAVMRVVARDFAQYVHQVFRLNSMALFPELFISVERGSGGDFVKRTGSACRSISNQEELAAGLEALSSRLKLNFTRLVLEDMSFVEQVSLFKRASIVVAQFGAALTNCLWTQPGAMFFEIASGVEQKETYKWFCRSLSKVIYSRRTSVGVVSRNGYDTVFWECGFDVRVDVGSMVSWIESNYTRCQQMRAKIKSGWPSCLAVELSRWT